MFPFLSYTETSLRKNAFNIMNKNKEKQISEISEENKVLEANIVNFNNEENDEK